VGCRITGGRITGNGNVDPNGLDVEIGKGTGGGQVGAPCGCIGCFDDFNHIQGNWEYSRKPNLGNFKASEFNSLVCGCKDNNGDSIPLDGHLCGDREIGPTPPAAPANVACFTGIGTIRKTGLGKPAEPVAFRVNVEDRGEPGGGRNSAPTADVYRIEIWAPKGNEKAADLAAKACCNDPDPTLRAADIQDGGDLVHGNLQIHKQTPHGQAGVCPVPSGSCAE
jgi:hypothetical protein